MTRKLAFVFPGQGSQFVGMLNDFIADNSAIVAATCAEASAVLGYDIAELIAKDMEQQLNQTAYTQPALLVAGVIAWRIWQDEGLPEPSLLAGHSLGEYTALVCAGAMTLAAAVKLVAKRGELMQQAVPAGSGAMAAILGLDLTQVEAVCNFNQQQLAGPVGDNGCLDLDLDIAQVANINAPGQVVIAGTVAAVNAAIEQAKTLGAKRAIMLPVSVPSHCMLMRAAAEEFMPYLNAIQWQLPRIPVVHNFDVMRHGSVVDIAQSLKSQLFNPVRWVETIEYFAQQEVSEIIECGPGKVLTGLNKRIAPHLVTKAIGESLGAGIC